MNSLKGREFPNLEKIDDLDYQKQLSELSELEEKKFNYYNPVKHNNFSQRRMYWNSTVEVIGRLFIIIGQLSNIAMAYLFGFYFAGKLAANLINPDVNPFEELNWTVSQGITNLMVIFAASASLLMSLPMVLCRTAGSIYGWGIFYIILSIIYFLIFEIFYSVILLVSSLITEFLQVDVKLTSYFIVATLAISIISLTGACFLIVKSDDIKRKISIEE